MNKALKIADELSW